MKKLLCKRGILTVLKTIVLTVVLLLMSNFLLFECAIDLIAESNLGIYGLFIVVFLACSVIFGFGYGIVLFLKKQDTYRFYKNIYLSCVIVFVVNLILTTLLVTDALSSFLTVLNVVHFLRRAVAVLFFGFLFVLIFSIVARAVCKITWFIGSRFH